LGFLYDTEVMDIDEAGCIQLVVFGTFAKEEADCLPGHIWEDRQVLEVQNLKYFCPKTLEYVLSKSP